MLALLVTIALTQDPQLDDLIKRLGDDDFAAREEAQAALVKRGEAALAKLREAAKSSDAEVAKRAGAAIEAIERNRVVTRGLGEGRRVTVDLKDAPLADLGKALGIDVRVPDAAKEKRITVDARGQELLRVLDAVARQTGLAYRVDGRAVAWTTDPFVDAPAAYAGPLKFRVARVRSTSQNDFAKRTTDLELTVAVEREPGAAEIAPAVRVVKAADDAGRALEWAPEPALRGGGNFSMSSMTVNGRTFKVVSDGVTTQVIEEGGPAEGPMLRMRGIAGAVTKLKSLRCEASFLIPSGAKKAVTFEKPAAGASQTAGEIEVTVEHVGEKAIELALRLKDGGRLDADALAKDSIVLRSGGKEIEAPPLDDDEADPVKDARRFARQMQRQGDGAVRVRVQVPKSAREAGVDAISFSVKELVKHTVELEFKDVDVR